jgi:glycosyltransferase involved in cell wall biosynthesis
VILHYLPAAVRRPVVAVVSRVLVRAPVMPTRGQAGRLVRRKLLGDVKAGRRSPTRTVRRLDRSPSPSSDLLAGQILAAAGHSELAQARLLAAAERWPDAGTIRYAAARALLRAKDPAAGRHIAGAVAGDTRGLKLSDLLDAAVESRSTEALMALRRALPASLVAVDQRVAEDVRRWSALADLVESHRRGGDAALAGSLPDGEASARRAVRWALDEGSPSLIRRVCEAVQISRLDRWTARHAASALRRSGDFTLSTALAEHVLRLCPDDTNAQRLVEVGHSGLRSLIDGWLPPEHRRDDTFRGRDHAVAYLLHNSLPYASAGYATRTHGLLKALVRDGWDVHGVTRLGFPIDQLDPADERLLPAVDDIDGVCYHRLVDSRRVYHKWPIGSFVDDYTRRVEQLLRTHQLGIVHAASNYWNGFAAVGAARRLGLPSIYEVRGLWELTRMSRDPGYEQSEMFALTAQLETEACLHADHVLAITGALRELMIERGVPQEKITVLPNGVDTTWFTPRHRDAALAEELGLTEKVVIGYVGSVLDYEGIDMLLQAVSGFLARNDFHVLIVGDGTELDSCRSKSESLGLTDLVTFTGRIPHHDVGRYYSLVDIAPFPRKSLPVCETVSPLKPFEAMATGKVPVVSSVAALTEIVTDGENGLVFEKGDVGALAAALERLVDDRGLRDRLSMAARDWVVRERDWAVLVRTLEAIYADLVANRPVSVAEPASRGTL